MDATLNPAGIAAQALTRGLTHDDFDGIVREHQQRVYRVILALVRDADLAANLTQDCFVRAYEKRESFRDDASIATWLTRIAINLVRDHARNRRQRFWKKLFQRPPEEPGDPMEPAALVKDPGALPERQLLVREEMAAVWAAVDALPGQQREAFVLRFAEEMSLEEIAGAMGVEVGTVKSHLSRALKTVREAVRGGTK